MILLLVLHIAVKQLQQYEHDLGAHQVFEPDAGIDESQRANFISTGDTSLDAIGFQRREEQ